MIVIVVTIVRIVHNNIFPRDGPCTTVETAGDVASYEGRKDGDGGGEGVLTARGKQTGC